MEYLYILAAANYNCENTDASAYGEGGYGTCTSVRDTTTPPSQGSTTTTTPSAPNTGFLSGMIASGTFSIVAPLVVAIVVAVVAVSLARKKRNAKQ